MRKLPIVVMILGLAGCAGTDPSASGVFPTAGFLGRSVRVEISGDATAWGASSKVSFGEGITVDSVTVASPTALFADITIADTAPVGLRDVVVTGGDNVTLKQAFEIESPITITLRGSLAQGSIATVDVVNHDFDTPFDTTSIVPVCSRLRYSRTSPPRRATAYVCRSMTSRHTGFRRRS